MSESRNILVVDGNQTSKREMIAVLENWGCPVTSAHDKVDALLKVESTPFALVILAAEAPGMAAVDFILNAKERRPEINVITISSDASVDQAIALMRAGSFDFLTGTVTTEQLLASVENAFKRADEGRREQGKGKKVRIITKNPEMLRIQSLVDQVADSTASILIKGESGTGKELFARYIHEKSKRNKGPFVAVNCAALPENLLESELFGHEKGAFTGAISRKAGRFEQADKGTLLLDEITEMQLHLQSKLLRVIQEKEVDRLGGGAPVPVDVRIVATTNRNITEWVEKGEFREDLFYRLNVIPLSIPPLRTRLDDIELLCEYFIRKFNAIDGRHVKCLTKEALDQLKRLPLKGNVRELENIIQRAVLLARTDMIAPEDLFLETPDAPVTPVIGVQPGGFSEELLSSPLRDMEKKMIFHTLDKTGWNRTHAATLLGISVRTLRNKLNEYKEGGGDDEEDGEV